MRLATALILLTLPAGAETISQEIARSGLTATQTRLALLPDPSDAERFALGGVSFLRAAEGSFQNRYAMGMTEPPAFLSMPLLRLPLAANPNPVPFDPAVIANIFREAETHLTAAQTALAAIPDTSDFGLTLNLGDLWFDVNANATRDPGEDLMNIAGSVFLDRQPTPSDLAAPAPVIRFDVADVAWLSAYAHLLTAISQMVQAYDPTEPITRILNARATMAQWGPSDGWLSRRSVPDELDMLAIVIATLDQPPDAARMLSALDHLLACIAQNRRFWTLVAAETDNAAEWVPNDAQTSGLGIPLPPGIGAAWQSVLADADAVLLGETAALFPHR